MVKQTIQIFCRLKPTKLPAGHFEINEDDDGSDPTVSFSVPRELSDGYINNKKEVYRFKFDRLFNTKASQDSVFDVVAKPVIENVLMGYNGTIFAYGQTGSGKTFTITGGAERYVDRGVIPRSLSFIFQQHQKSANAVHTTHISYLEIYNEFGYDLLDPRHEAAKLEDLPKVSLLEDNDGNIHLKNLTLHPSANEEEALNLLFLGDTNRMIAETPMNQASTRSHCIFTIHVSTREPNSATIRRSKLHLVDLAGSERVSKTGVDGVLLKEAKYINLSLHFLEQVIVALSEKSRNHIPYRNSMMTSVLRDSLGGNCKTSMIATCAIDKRNIDESISTCRFAQRVALIKNDAILNEEIDPQLVIIRLKNEVRRLKDELSLATGEQHDADLTQDEIESLRNLVQDYLADDDEMTELSVGPDMRKINYCFSFLKRQFHSRNANAHASRASVADDNSYLADKSQCDKLKDLIRQRDNEINILVGMLKKEKQKAVLGPPSSSFERASDMTADSTHDDPPRLHDTPSQWKSDRQTQRNHVTRVLASPLSSSQPETASKVTESRPFKHTTPEMSRGRQEAFEVFRRDDGNNATIVEHKRILKQRYVEAKALGEKVNHCRVAINTLKGRLEQHRIRRSMQDDNCDNDSDVIEQTLRSELEENKKNYKAAFNELKGMKVEIEHLQFLLEKSRVQLQKDFDSWWTNSTIQDSSDGFSPPSDLTVNLASESVSLGRALPPSRQQEQADPVRPSSNSSAGLTGIQLTGDAKVDANIMAFVQARQSFMEQRGTSR